jgi:DNA-binding NtrC family response regulator
MTCVAPADRIGDLMAFSPNMRAVLNRIRRVARTEFPVLVTGPSGSGKELVAHAIHAESARRAGPFLAINCGALNASLVEAELFGHVRGAFTGAHEAKEGAFEACRGGTLFLDEIGELPLELQPKLLRVLEASAVRRIGASREEHVDTRIVAATHRNLLELVAAGRFREDLYHRLMFLDVVVPPLAERPQDILALASHFLARCPGAPRLSEEAERALLGHRWSGNVRELRNVLVRAAVLCETGTIEAADLELRVVSMPVSDLTITPNKQRDRFVQLLRDCNNNRAEAARRLGLSRSTLHAQLRRAGLPLKFARD